MKNSALLIIDVQEAMFSKETPVHNGDECLKKIIRLADKARRKGIPIIYIQHQSDEDNDPLQKGSPGWEIHSSVNPQKEDWIIAKDTPNAFHKTGLNSELKKMGVAHLVVCGIQTEMCVDTTCRSAYSLGYDVILVKDAHTTWDSPHLNAMQIIEHHNRVLSRCFVKLKNADDIDFDFSDSDSEINNKVTGRQEDNESGRVGQ
ncbi:nicotinamidase-related amidase [Scopulibacillus daqui]|uniref:Nicotinamidase-related amidase n=1 Tax=Scopulibacillus daqui TaxID=1469162 RepID=A0ABS2PZX7_9BACL|nr:cysteine hydrolase family protein [Scopulibacillus daqui]MBM7645588.1 nicotinamidase-related amidase [Scopulibacillus daqui]